MVVKILILIRLDMVAWWGTTSLIFRHDQSSASKGLNGNSLNFGIQSMLEGHRDFFVAIGLVYTASTTTRGTRRELNHNEGSKNSAVYNMYNVHILPYEENAYGKQKILTGRRLEANKA
jgi:hypothetical protein